jgi:hypothetical protein
MNKKIRYALVALALVIVLSIGLVSCQDEDDPIVQQGVSNLDSLHLSDTGGTATPALRVNQDGTGKIIELLDASTPVWAINDGGAFDIDGAGGLDVDTTGAISLDADTASNFSVAGAGIDLTLESEAGRLVLKGDEAAANGVTIDANDAVTTGLDIDVGSVSGMTIDGGLLDVGGGSCAVADGDNDVCIAAVLEVDGELEADGAIDADSTLDVAGIVTLAGLLRTSFADLAVSDGDTITPTVTTYALDTSGAVTVTLAASAAEGQLLVLINDDANATIIADTNIRTSTGAALTMAGAYDILVFIYQDSEWLELLAIADS